MADYLPQVPQGVLDFASDVGGTVRSASDKISSSLSAFESSDIGKKVGSILDPSGIRLQVAGLLAGGGKKSNSPTAAAGKAEFANSSKDWRVKIALGNDATYFYKSEDAGILAPLIGRGVIFPYTPSISVTHAARYGAQTLTHSNYTNYSYEGSEVQTINITGDFTAQDNDEALYVLACLHFFRSATKMWFGGGSNVGNPPPVVFLNGYGSNYFPNVPCVVTSFQHTMPPDVDYIPAIRTTASTKIVSSTGKPGESNQARAAAEASNRTSVTESTSTMVPTSSQMVISLQPIYSRKNVFNTFDLDEFARGKLLGDKKFGGFI